MRILWKPSVFNEVFNIKDIKAHVTDLTQKLLLKINKKVRLLFHISLLAYDGTLVSQLVPNLSLLMLVNLSWNNVLSLHEAQKLSWDLLEHLFSQKPWIVLKFRERHELNNVTVHELLVFV